MNAAILVAYGRPGGARSCATGIAAWEGRNLLRPHWTPRIGGEQMAGQALGRFALQRLGQDTQDAQDSQDYACLERKLASLSLAHKPFSGPQAFHWRVSLPCHRPGCLGCPECLGQPVKNEIPSGRPAYLQWHSLWNSAADWERRHLGGA